jgi:hypothetical protein
VNDNPVKLAAVLDLQQVLLQDVCFAMCGQVLDAGLFREFSESLRRRVSPKVTLETLQKSIFDVAGSMLTLASAEAVSWRLAGNYPRLRRRVVIPPWPSQVIKEWSIFRVERVVSTNRPVYKAVVPGSYERGYRVTLRSLSGLSAGTVIKPFWSYAFCDNVKVNFGFSRRNRAGFRRHVSRVIERSFTSPNEFYGMYVLGLVDPDRVRDGIPSVREFKSSAMTLRPNISLWELRTRDEWACPRGFPEQHACSKCEIGSDVCRAACHARTYEAGLCSCGVHGLVDPEVGLCLKCSHR